MSLCLTAVEHDVTQTLERLDHEPRVSVLDGQVLAVCVGVLLQPRMSHEEVEGRGAPHGLYPGHVA